MKLRPNLLVIFLGFLLLQSCATAKKEELDSFPLLSEAEWNQLFPHINGGDSANTPFYSYAAFVKATKRFPEFLTDGSLELKKRELAAFLATISHETGGGDEKDMAHFYDYGLYYKQELSCLNGCEHYSDTTDITYPPVKGKSYHGRGPIQLSWNYNYGMFSEMVLENKDSLLNHPDLLISNPELSFATAIWFWVTPQEPKPSCHEVISGKWVPTTTDSLAGRKPGFGAVMNIVNGGLECGGVESVKNKFRLQYYLAFCKKMKVDPGPNISCNSQQPYGQ
ncbi:MAG: hypothetical protein RL135_2449 [Bacteroidota bacterium]|jgi:hypothetical protein